MPKLLKRRVTIRCGWRNTRRMPMPALSLPIPVIAKAKTN